jgi:DNA uptake protein ComE-like DNA-binding protein
MKVQKSKVSSEQDVTTLININTSTQKLIDEVLDISFEVKLVK